METPSQISIVSGGPTPAASLKYPAALSPSVLHLVLVVCEEPQETHLTVTPTVTALSLAALDLPETCLPSRMNQFLTNLNGGPAAG